MKRILITGANSYIGTSFEAYMSQYDEYQIETLDMLDPSWKEKSFSGYDAIFHVAGIAHQKETKKNRDLYYLVNRDLAIDVSKKAKAENASQLIFLSSMSVYGMVTGEITKETKPNPNTHYGKSKLQAEEEIIALDDESFKVCIVRPPMIYGKGCKGNYNSLVKMARKLPFFPKVKNQRSMLYIDNLSEFVKQLIDNEQKGYFYPQNKEYTNTSEMVRLIGEAHGKKIRIVRGFAWAIKFFGLFIGAFKKAFGSLTYDESLRDLDETYCVVELEKSILLTEQGEKN